MEYTGWTDRGLNESKETTLSIKILAERASKECSSNGDGYELLEDFFLREASWHSFLPHEQRILEKTIRRFAKALREAGFIEGKG